MRLGAAVLLAHRRGGGPSPGRTGGLPHPGAAGEVFTGPAAALPRRWGGGAAGAGTISPHGIPLRGGPGPADLRKEPGSPGGGKPAAHPPGERLLPVCGLCRPLPLPQNTGVLLPAAAPGAQLYPGPGGGKNPSSYGVPPGTGGEGPLPAPLGGRAAAGRGGAPYRGGTGRTASPWTAFLILGPSPPPALDGSSPPALASGG